jgi:soluble lytic murein transglycosylase-like protein
MIRAPALVLGGLCGMVACGPRAEVWGFVDGRGVARFAPTQVDSRYELIVGSPDKSAAGRVAGKTDGARKLATWLEIAPEVKALQGILREAARQYSLDVELLKAVIAVESGFDARAVSPRGALGLMQIMPAAADRHATPAEARRPAEVRLLEPCTNVLTGARMLRRLLDRYDGRHDVALAAWNAGEGTVRRHGNKMPAIAETRAHVQMVLELYWALLQRGTPRTDSPPAPNG